MSHVNPKLVAIFVIVAVVLGVAYVVVKPDRDACALAMGRQFDAVLAADQPVDETSVDAKAMRDKLRWPCRFQSDQSMDQIGREVLASRMPEVLTKALASALSSVGQP